MARILVVDDEPDIREVIRCNLEAAGHEVATAGSAGEAARAIACRRPDAIFLDAVMPGTDGWCVLARLKAGDPSVACIPVVMVTALSQTEDRLRGAIEGAVRYLTKPFHPADLTDVLAEVLAPGAPPEAEQRRRVRQHALETLARLEAGSHGRRDGARPTVHLTRLEHPPVRATPPPLPPVAQHRIATLTRKQRHLLQALRRTGSVGAVADEAGTSRSNVYASTRRIAHRLGVRSTTELLKLVYAGQLDV